jgi:hypothetical protein
MSALWLSGSSPALAEEPPYPVWWSPVLELDSLEGIDARLHRALWPGNDEGMLLITTEDGIVSEASATLIWKHKKGGRGSGWRHYY